MSDLLKYMCAQAEKDAAYQQYNYAGQLLENRQIKCRFAEIQSQYEPLESITKTNKAVRDQMVDACRYVLTGQLPKAHP